MCDYGVNYIGYCRTFNEWLCMRCLKPILQKSNTPSLDDKHDIIDKTN
ncbi:MAG TPA: hypothetical protein VIH04_03985 [Nitrosarchaeum sp.]